ncbi:phosphatase PAP2 family protein [Thiohalocapsa marina]|uniref:undecaprenyl-diphosphate phosphatase n=1 Tax=Thiohalocapsa marina TaxID=424902 RepID=A0A5M8FHG4_9GAMM|nr:phosphatase PAP2 family protein [Thiohalocapsa marina]KAA6184149.1 phosphatase PAP2 family protein [Thiohalocapsa marina]
MPREVSGGVSGKATGGLLGRLRDDLSEALVAGAARTPAVSPGGTLWLTRWAVAVAAAGLSLYLLVGYHAGFSQLNSAAALAPDWLWACLTVLGDERVAFALALLLARRWPRVFWALICAALVATAYSRGLKPLFDAARPPAVLSAEAFNLIGPGHKRHSFPSGHSVTAAVFFAVLVYYARTVRWRTLFLLLGVAAGLSRVAVGVHWPVDVAAGLAGGIAAAWVGTWLARKSPWGVLDASVHLAFVVVAAVMALSLWHDNGGYAEATLFLQALSVVALGYAALAYLLWPLWRAMRQQPAVSSY